MDCEIGLDPIADTEEKILLELIGNTDKEVAGLSPPKKTRENIDNIEAGPSTESTNKESAGPSTESTNKDSAGPSTKYDPYTPLVQNDPELLEELTSLCDEEEMTKLYDEMKLKTIESFGHENWIMSAMKLREEEKRKKEKTHKDDDEPSNVLLPGRSTDKNDAGPSIERRQGRSTDKNDAGPSNEKNPCGSTETERITGDDTSEFFSKWRKRMDELFKKIQDGTLADFTEVVGLQSTMFEKLDNVQNYEKKEEKKNEK